MEEHMHSMTNGANGLGFSRTLSNAPAVTA
jgi:hypothetical protein